MDGVRAGTRSVRVIEAGEPPPTTLLGSLRQYSAVRIGRCCQVNQQLGPTPRDQEALHQSRGGAWSSSKRLWPRLSIVGAHNPTKIADSRLPVA